MPRLIVKNFGPIKDLDLEIKGYMVFVGPQASGKSTISKLIYFFEKLWDELCFPEDSIRRNLLVKNETLKTEFLANTSFLEEKLYSSLSSLEIDLFGSINSAYFLNYTFCENYSIQVSNVYSEKEQDYYPSHYLSEDLDKLISEQEEYLNEIFFAKEQHNWDLTQFKQMFEMSGAPMKNVFEEIKFIPTGRSITTLLSNQLQNVELSQIDHLTGLFIRNITNIRTWFKKGFKELIDKISGFLDKELLVETINNIMKGDYIFEFQNERIRVNNETDVSINFSSSGQQEALSVILTCLYYMWKGDGTQLHIEEPEAHLYPSSQKSIVDLLSLFFNYGRNRVVITTHSPYILASINNLLYAHKIGRDEEEAANKIIDKNLWIDPTRLGAYKVTAEGTVENIIDEDLGIIQNESIDEIAQLINQQFDALFDLEKED